MRRYLGLLFLVLCGTAHAKDLAHDTANLVNIIFPGFAVSEQIYCATADQNHRSKYPQADYLLNIATADNLVVFVHGMTPDQRSGSYTLNQMASLWRYHVDLLEELKGRTSYCVVTWDSDYGFDDEPATLGRFLALLDTTLRDSRRPKGRTNVTLVGHGAGGNYIKYSYLYFLEARKEIKTFGLPLQAPNYKFHIITLSTPHLGVEAKKIDGGSDATAVYMTRLAGYLMGDVGALARPISTAKYRTRGAKQLLEIESNEALYQLNREFSKRYPKSEIFAVGSDRDKSVPSLSATPRFARGFGLDVDHQSFLQPYKSESLSHFLKVVYQGQHPEIGSKP